MAAISDVTQFMYTKLALNPAYAGNDPYTNLLLYRDQWAGFPVPLRQLRLQ